MARSKCGRAKLSTSLTVAVWKAPWLLPSTFNFLKPEVTWRQRLAQSDLYKRLIQRARLPKGATLPASDYPKRLTYPLNVDEALSIVEHFRPYLTLDGLSNDQLSALAAALDLNDWGTNSMLIRRIHKHMDYLLNDDELLRKEGLNAMTDDEILEACDQRGLDVNERFELQDLKAQLREWLELSQRAPEARLPLLIYHYAFYHNNPDVSPLWMGPKKPTAPKSNK